MRSMLVVGRGLTDPQTGVGQRTHVVYAALRALGDVMVVIERDAQAARALRAVFPDAADVVGLNWRPPLVRLPGGRSIAGRIARLPVFFRLFRPDAAASAELRRIIAGCRPDLVVFRFFGSYALCAGEGAALEQLKPLVVVDLDDRDDLMMERNLSAHLGAAGRWFFRHVAGPVARAAFRRLLSGVRLVLVPAARDAGFGFPVRTAIIPNTTFEAPPPERLVPPSAASAILFVGTLYYSNRHGVAWFLRHCWPAIVARAPNARFIVVGKGPRGGWSRALAPFQGAPGLEVVGEVEDLTAEYRRSRVVIAPLFDGGGTKIKVLEACRHRRPVVATPSVAHGFDKGLRETLFVADTPEAFTDHCLRLLEDGALADRAGAASAAIERRDYARDSVEARLRAALSAAVDAGSTPPA